MTDKPKIQLTEAQLRAIANIAPNKHDYRMQDALRPIGRERLVGLWRQARVRTIDAYGPIQGARLGGADWQHRPTHLPPRPVDEPALQAALQALAEAEATEAEAWQRIQRLIDRAKELLAARPSGLMTGSPAPVATSPRPRSESDGLAP